MELRCDSKRLFGILDGDTVEVSCRSQRCGFGEGVVVLHRFSTRTGELLDTKLYKNARKERA